MTDRIDSRKLVEDRNELADLDALTSDERIKLYDLKRVVEELRENCDEEPEYGITMVPEKDWVEYVEELIDELYPMDTIPDQFRNDWPYRHIKYDYEAAAQELKSDYAEIEYQDVTYLCR